MRWLGVASVAMLTANRGYQRPRTEYSLVNLNRLNKDFNDFTSAHKHLTVHPRSGFKIYGNCRVRVLYTNNVFK